MCLLCAYITRMVSGWPMPRGQPAIVDGASVREPARFAPLRKGAPGNFKVVGATSYRSMAAANVDLSAAAVAAPSPARPPRLAGSVPRARLQACEAAPTAARAAQRGCCR